MVHLFLLQPAAFPLLTGNSILFYSVLDLHQEKRQPTSQSHHPDLNRDASARLIKRPALAPSPSS